MSMSKFIKGAVFVSALASSSSAFALADSSRYYTLTGGNSTLGVSLKETTLRTGSVESTRIKGSVVSTSGIYVNLAGNTVPVYGINMNGYSYYVNSSSVYFGDLCPDGENCFYSSGGAAFSVMGQSITVPGNGYQSKTRYYRYLSASYDKNVMSTSYNFMVGFVPVTIGVDVVGTVGATMSAYAEGQLNQTMRAHLSTSATIQPTTSLKVHAYGGVGFGSVAGLRLSADLTVIKLQDKIRNDFQGYIFHGEKKTRFNVSEDSILQSASGLGGSVYVEQCLGTCSRVFSVGSWSGYSTSGYAWRDAALAYGPYDGFAF